MNPRRILAAAALALLLGAGCELCSGPQPVTPRQPTCGFYDPATGRSYCPG